MEPSHTWRSRCFLAAIFVALSFAALVSPALAAETFPPHVAETPEKEACAMCHRGHTSASSVQRLTESGKREGSALLVGVNGVGGDTELCYACHGMTSLGSGTDVQTSLESTSAHSIAPVSSPFGPTKKDCSACHDSHGTARDASGSPYPALLRAFPTSGGPEPIENAKPVYKGDEFCATCHAPRAGNEWSGLDVWRQTAHAREMTGTASGTGILCANCHAPHGSANTAMIVERLVPPAVEASVAVPANDRRLCFGCHSGALRTYAGEERYAGGHGSSEQTAPVEAEWAESGESRRVGECQVCHDAMGRSDGDGGVLSRLTNDREGDLCIKCHNATGGAALDLDQFRFPDSEQSRPEVAMVWDPQRLPDVFGSLSLFAAETTGTAPRPLFGPREWEVQARTGNATYGDIDGDAVGETIVADLDLQRLQVFAPEPMGGVTRTDIAVDDEPTFIAIGDILIDGTGRAEVAVVSREATAPYSSELRLYRYQSASLTLVAGPYPVGSDVTGIAAGDVTGTPAADLAITSAGDDSLRIVTEATSGTEPVVIGPAKPTRRGPRGPSIGDAWDGGGREILVANAGETTGTLSVFDGAGSRLASYDATGHAGATAYDTLVADVVPQWDGAESVVALRHATGTSSIAVYRAATGGGLAPVGTYDTGAKYNSASLDAGDVDADGRRELVVGNAGWWGYGVTGASGVAPSVQVFSFGESGAGSSTSSKLIAGGAELAGGDPDVLAVDLGAVGRSGHREEAVSGAHSSTETAGFTERHSECADCHNPHESSSTVSPAPAVRGVNTGTWGVDVAYEPANSIGYTEQRGVENEYQLCFKCHSGWTRSPGSDSDIASQFDSRQASFHGVVTSATASTVPSGSFVATSPALTDSSVMLCTTCHSNADQTQPRGPHASKWAPILAAPYSGVRADDSGLLCYRCHKSSVYATGSEPGVESNFWGEDQATQDLHKLHIGDRGFACSTCHVSHGSANAHLIRSGLDWKHYETGGACFTPCHAGGVSNVYSRAAASSSTEITATSISASAGSILSGSLADAGAQDGSYLEIGMDSGTPGLDARLSFPATSQPSSFSLRGRYAGTSDMRVDAEIWNFTTSSWVDLGRMPETTTDSTHVYPVPDETGFTQGGEVRVRLVGRDQGDVSNRVLIDRTWVSQ